MKHNEDMSEELSTVISGRTEELNDLKQTNQELDSLRNKLSTVEYKLKKYNIVICCLEETYNNNDIT